MKNRFLLSLLAATALTYAPAAFAVDPIPAATASAAGATSTNSIVVVNMQTIMRDSTAAKSLREQVENKQKTFQAEITKKEDALQKEDQELGKQRSVLSKEAFEEKVRVFRNKATDVQKEVQSKKALLDDALERALNDIQKSVTDIIAEMAKEKGFTLALQNSPVLFSDPKLDISNEVLTRLNQRLPKLDVKFDAPAEPKK